MSVDRRLSGKLGTVRGVRFENIRVLTDSTEIRPIVRVVCIGERENVSDISLRGLFLNGEEQKDLSAFEEFYDNFEGKII